MTVKRDLLVSAINSGLREWTLDNIHVRPEGAQVELIFADPSNKQTKRSLAFTITWGEKNYYEPGIAISVALNNLETAEKPGESLLPGDMEGDPQHGPFLTWMDEGSVDFVMQFFNHRRPLW